MNTNVLECQVHDTFKLRLIVENLKSPKQHKAFWDMLYESDQYNQTKFTTDSINERNLLLTSLYVNKFGFPNPIRCGKHGKIAAWIWIHSKYIEMEKFTFPIILKGYMANVLSRDYFFNYFLSGLYVYEFDNSKEYKNMTLKDLISILKLNASQNIDIKRMIVMLDSFHLFERGHKEILGAWKIVVHTDTLKLGDTFIIEPASKYNYQLFKHENGKYYFGYIVFGQEYREIEFLNDLKTTFKEKYYQGSRYYVIESNGDLTWRVGKTIRHNMNKMN